MKKFSKILLVSILGVFLVSGTAMALPLLDFADGDAAGIGSITITGSGDVIGSGIALDRLLAVELPSNNGTYDLQGPINFSNESAAVLSFDTSSNTIQISGSVPSLGVTNQVLLSGSFSSWDWDGEDFYATGVDTKADDLLIAFGMVHDYDFSFVVFSLNTELVDGSIIPVSVDLKNTVVPEPATMLLFGTGLLGLAVIGRKKFLKKS